MNKYDLDKIYEDIMDNLDNKLISPLIKEELENLCDLRNEDDFWVFSDLITKNNSKYDVLFDEDENTYVILINKNDFLNFVNI